MATNSSLVLTYQMVFVGLLLLVVSTTHAQNLSCSYYGEEDTVRFRDSCYYFNIHSPTEFSWISEHHCFIRYLGHLLVIDDQEEDNFIRTYAKGLFEDPTNVNATFWVKGVGPNTTYTNWASTKDAEMPYLQPGCTFDPDCRVGGDRPCFPRTYHIALVGQEDFKWKKLLWAEQHYTICEFRPSALVDGNWIFG